jgi:hypothetical protein
MAEHGDKKFPDKHGREVKLDKTLGDEILSRAKEGNLACAVAFDIAKSLDTSAAAVGLTADLLNLNLAKCQLGLFGYGPGKKMMKPPENIDTDLKNAITAEMEDGYLPCIKAWDISHRFKLSKLTVSGACEVLKVKIKPCQLGAF